MPAQQMNRSEKDASLFAVKQVEADLPAYTEHTHVVSGTTSTLVLLEVQPRELLNEHCTPHLVSRMQSMR